MCCPGGGKGRDNLDKDCCFRFLNPSSDEVRDPCMLLYSLIVSLSVNRCGFFDASRGVASRYEGSSEVGRQSLVLVLVLFFEVGPFSTVFTAYGSSRRRAGKDVSVSLALSLCGVWRGPLERNKLDLPTGITLTRRGQSTLCDEEHKANVEWRVESRFRCRYSRLGYGSE